MSSPPLRLLAQDEDDLLLISAALQDGVVKLADISYAPAARTLTFPLSRFPLGGRGAHPRRGRRAVRRRARGQGPQPAPSTRRRSAASWPSSSRQATTRPGAN